MKKLILIPFFLLSFAAMAACSGAGSSTAETEQPSSGVENPDIPEASEQTSKTLIAYFSATGNTEAVAKRIKELTGGDVYHIRAAKAYAQNPYDNSERIQREAYDNLRPEVANLPSVETVARYDTIFVGSPIWWHQPAMVICTFLESYDLSNKTIIPFFTYGATSYLNESMQKIYAITPHSAHIPATLPEDLDPEDITTPGRPDDNGIAMPGNANGTEAWLREIGVIK